MDVSPGTVRLGKHSDYALLTFLFQDMIGGLEVNVNRCEYLARGRMREETSSVLTAVRGIL